MRAVDAFPQAELFQVVSWLVSPRPIAWVTSCDSSGRRNLAPFSFFTVASTDPLILMIAVEPREDRSRKDTLRNVLDTGRFVVHIPRAGQVGAVAGSADIDDPEVDELAVLELATGVSSDSGLPIVDGCIAAFECELNRTLRPGLETLLFGRVTSALVEDELIDERHRVRAGALHPLGRIGNVFTTTTLIEPTGSRR